MRSRSVIGGRASIFPVRALWENFPIIPKKSSRAESEMSQPRVFAHVGDANAVLAGATEQYAKRKHKRRIKDSDR